tara:strand:+ start:314 stop:598 length:285 start_codon:yes stop_codon:yes gene_type:complete
MIKKTIDNIADDKKDHVLLGMFIGYPLQLIGLILDITLGLSTLFYLGSFIGIALVLAKEVIHDWYLKKGNPEWWDFIASAIPIVFPIIIYILIK